MYKSNVNLNLYKTFYEVAKNKSISEAAKKTFSSQPAISKAIKNLENELNVKLFYRTQAGVELTEKGKELLFFVEQSFNNFVVAERNMVEDINLERGKLSIGMPSNIGSFFLFDKIVDFHNKYPNIEITIFTGSTSKLLEQLESRAVDFVIDTAPIISENKNLTIKELGSVDYCFFINKNTKIKHSIKSVKDLANLPLVLPINGTANRNDINAVFSKHKVDIKNVLNVYISEVIIAAFKRDLGIGYVIKNLVEDESDLEILKIKEELPDVMINLIYDRRYLTTAPHKFLVDYIDSNIEK